MALPLRTSDGLMIFVSLCPPFLPEKLLRAAAPKVQHKYHLGLTAAGYELLETHLLRTHGVKSERFCDVFIDTMDRKNPQNSFKLMRSGVWLKHRVNVKTNR